MVTVVIPTLLMVVGDDELAEAAMVKYEQVGIVDVVGPYVGD